MLLIAALLIGAVVALWLLTGVMVVAGWVLRALYYLCWAAWMTTLGLVRGGRWGYGRVAQWRRDRAVTALLR